MDDPIPTAERSAGPAAAKDGDSLPGKGNSESIVKLAAVQSTVPPPLGISSEDRDRRLAEARAQQALRLQRKQRLGLLVQKRKTNLSYLKKVHQGNCNWLNATMFSPEDIGKYVRTMVPPARGSQFFALGLSISRLLAIPNGIPTVRACAQLLEEFEYLMSGAAMQGVKYFTAKPSQCVYPQSALADADMKAALHKFNNAVVYEYLQVPHIAFELDYVEVVLSLCDALTALYAKFQHEDCFTHPSVYETILRFDARIKHHVINLAAKELTELAGAKVRSETQELRGLFGFSL